MIALPSFEFEQKLWARGYTKIAGVDEAGRGPLAGPVSAAAVILPSNYKSELLNDSKKLSQKRREILYEQLTTHPEVCWAISFVDAQVIDEINILRATHRAMAIALDSLINQPDIALIDGLPVKGLSIPHEALVKGDGLSLSIAAASIIAKVSRDRFMHKIDQEFPAYGFAQNQGYGTRKHLEALKNHGSCRYHRRSFQPISQLTLPLANGQKWFKEMER